MGTAIREPDAEQLLKVFDKFGADGRAIPVSSLARYVHFESDAKVRLTSALAHLLSLGLIRHAGVDPLERERAYRLAQPSSGRAPPECGMAA